MKFGTLPLTMNAIRPNGLKRPGIGAWANIFSDRHIRSEMFTHWILSLTKHMHQKKKKKRNWYDNPSPSTVGSFLLTVHFLYSKVHTIIWFKLSIRRSFLARLQSNKGRPSKLLAWNWWTCKKWILCFFFIGMVTWGEKQNYSFQTMQFMMHTI